MICVIVTAPGRPHVGNLEHRLKGHQACWVADTHGTGQRRTYWRALRVALDICDRYQLAQITVFEDDIELCVGALDYMEAFPVPGFAAWLEWFSGFHYGDMSSVFVPQFSSGAVPVVSGRAACLQAVTYPVATLRTLAATAAPAWWPRDRPHDGDDLLSWMAADLGWRWGVHIPNLVQHVGAQSLVDPTRTLTGRRISKNYPGADFDARTLWAGKAMDHG